MRKRRPIAEINVVPYIDVMLVLLVIFMITAPLLSQGVQVSLPQASSKTLPPMAAKPVVLTLTQDHHLFLNISPTPKTPMPAQSIVTYTAAYLRLEQAAHHDTHVFVKADKHIPYGEVIKAMTLLQKAGSKTVGLITKEEGS